jgi:hypothetical protein
MPDENTKRAWQLESSISTAKKARREKAPWTEALVYEKLSFCFPSPTFIVLPQVRSGTGFSKKIYRTADAIVASIYPSRGLYLSGVEIKITKSDFRKELREPEKSDEISRFCRFWYLAAPSGIIPVGEVPPSWGLIETRLDGATITKAAQQLDAQPPDISFVCAILRAAKQSFTTSHAQESEPPNDIEPIATQ